MNLLPTLDDLLLKADLLLKGVDFSAPGLMECLCDERKLRSGTGLYNYHREKSSSATISFTPALNVLGQSNSKAPNELIFPDFGYPFRAEVRSTPDSPYRVVSTNNLFILENKCTGKAIYRVDFPVQEPFNFAPGPYGTHLGAVVHPMGKNALRIYPDMTCLMDQPGIKCRFCGTLPKRRTHPGTGEFLSDEMIIQEIRFGISEAQKDMPVDHIFMSAGAFYNVEKTRFYAQVIEMMRETLHNPWAEILFALTPPPPQRVRQLDLLVEAGVSDMSFNLEVWDPRRWDLSGSDFHIGEFKVRRGKKDHFSAFKYTVEMLGPGSAKSNFVGGLEEHETLFAGADLLLSLGVVPSLTVYYPTPGAEWVESGIDPTTEGFRSNPALFLVEAYLGLAERTRNAGLRPHWAPENRISGLEWDALAFISNDADIRSRVEDKVKANEAESK